MIPVFVPSYKRPKATFLRRSLQYEFELYVFVREEEVEDYKWLKQRPNTHLVKMRGVNNIGETRRSMIKYALQKGIDRCFMLDDDVTRLDFSVWDEDRGYARASGTIKGKPENMDDVLHRWESIWEDEVLCGPLYRPFSIGIKNNRDIGLKKRRQLQQAVGIDVRWLREHGLNYQSNDIVGNEDLFLQYEVMACGGKTRVFQSLQYDCPEMGKGVGGCTDMYNKESQNERAERFKALATKKDWIRIDKSSSGIVSIKFNWHKIPTEEAP